MRLLALALLAGTATPDGGWRAWTADDERAFGEEEFLDADAGVEFLIDDEGTVDAGQPDAGGMDGGADGGPATRRVRGVAMGLDQPRRGELRAMRNVVGLQAGDTVTLDAAPQLERRLLELGTLRAVRCAVEDVDGVEANVRCGAHGARVVRAYRVEGLPLSVLRRELDKHVFLRPGERLDLPQTSAADRVDAQRRRIQHFLGEEGLFGRDVDVLVENTLEDARSVDVRIVVPPLSPARVGRVEVEGVPDHARGEIVQAVRGLPLEVFKPVRTRERLRTVESRWRNGRDHPEARIRFEWNRRRSPGIADVKVVARLGPRVRVTFENHSPAAVAALRTRLTFAVAGSADDSECEASVSSLRAYLEEQGWVDARVHWTRSGTAQDAQVTFHVKAQTPGVVQRVRIRGLGVLAEDLVRRQAGVSLAPRGRVLADAHPPLVSSALIAGSTGTFSRDALLADTARIEKYLAANGYPEATVVPRVSAVAGGGAVEVEFLVEEGPRYVVQEVTFRGHAAETDTTLRRVAGVHPRSPFNPNALDEYRARLLEHYARRGFLRTTVQPLLDFDAEGRTHLRFVIDEGPRSRLAGILLQGNDRTSGRIIRRELGLSVGDPLDPVAVEEAVARLRRTGVFRRVVSRLVGLGGGARNVHLVILLEERPPRTLDGAVGVSTAEYLSLSAEARDRNALGWMVDASATAQVGPLALLSLAAPQYGLNIDPPQVLQDFLGAQVGIRSRNRVNLQLRMPRVLSTRANVVGSLDAEARDRPIPAASTDASLTRYPTVDVGGLALPVPFTRPSRRLYDQERFTQLTARIGLEVPVVRWFTTGVAYGYEAFARQLVDSPNRRWDLGLPTLAGWLEGRAQVNLLDNPFDPRKGVLAAARIKGGSRLLLGEGEFLVLSGQLAGYWTWERLTLAMSARGTAVIVDGAAGNKRVVPRNDLGLAGGDRSVRGYDEDAIRVRRHTLRRGVNPDDPRSIANEPGLYSVVVNTEARLAVLRGAGVGDVQLATFLDAAQVTDTLPPWAISLQHRSTEVGLGAGAGIRYVTPVGPIAIDYGFDLLRLPRGRLHIQFGYTF